MIHHEDKKKLEDEAKELQSQVNSIENDLHEVLKSLNTEHERVSDRNAVYEAEKNIKQLSEQLSHLGIFKRKEKKEIIVAIEREREKKTDEENRILNARRNIESRIQAAKDEASQKSLPMRKRIDEITAELTKDRL